MVRSSRQLDVAECQQVWRGLGSSKWGMTHMGWWAPRRQLAQYPVAQFSSAVFDPNEENNVSELLRLALVTHGVSRVYELREHEDFSHEIDAGAIEVLYRGEGEGVWTDDTFEWVIYADHEDCVTVAGDWLLPDLKAVWPAWRDSLYREP